MGMAKAEVTGFVMATRDGYTNKSGKRYFSIAVSTGKSEKLQDGSYDNSNQTIWNLTAYGEYAEKLISEHVKKGDKVRCVVPEPRPHMFQGKDGKMKMSLEGPLFNHSLSMVFWVPKDAKTADNYVPHDEDAAAPGADDWDPSQYENMGQ